jgi:hypothetical protein
VAEEVGEGVIEGDGEEEGFGEGDAGKLIFRVSGSQAKRLKEAKMSPTFLEKSVIKLSP